MQFIEFKNDAKMTDDNDDDGDDGDDDDDDDDDYDGDADAIVGAKSKYCQGISFPRFDL